MPNSFEELLLEEMLEEEDDYLYDDFSFIDALIDEDEESLFDTDDVDEEDIFNEDEDEEEDEEDV